MAAIDSAHVKDKCDILNRLEVYAELSDKQMKDFKLQVIEEDCLSRFYPDNLPCLQEKYIRPDGTPHLFEDVQLEKIVETAETYIGELVPTERRARVFEQVMDGVPGVSETPYWTDSSVDPLLKNPETQFSISRASSDSVKSNSQLIESLASAADLGPRQTAALRGQLTWWDAVGDENNPAFLDSTTMSVSGGRLGRDHTLEDVPNHFVRDRLMDYINSQIDEDKREHARKSVFSDLSTSEVLEYASLAARLREEHEKMHHREEIIDDIIGSRHVHTRSEAKHIWEQADVMGDINVNIDLAPRHSFAHRTHEQQLSGSVIKPGQKVKFQVEAGIDCGVEIDRDCDQIRAMIKILTCDGGEWTVDQFRLALGHITRPQMTSFLEKRGPRKGVYSLSYQLGWNFFKLREILGCPLITITPPASPHRDVLQERDPNRGQKRLSTEPEGEPVKFTRTLSPIHEIPTGQGNVL
ncbi:hypothetical protein F4781DRAFT_54054 [Annulohypoxylon bovei var. microspora]|nr:hypothetical protein F4781DRAFT_54054 [Annulohypoxylon bovei var. microspora]